MGRLKTWSVEKNRHAYNSNFGINRSMSSIKLKINKLNIWQELK